MLTKAQTELFTKGIVHPDGTPDRNKLNTISGAHALPIAEAVWTLTDCDATVCDSMVALLRKLYDAGMEGEALQLLMLIYALIGYAAPDDINAIGSDPSSLRCFLEEVLLDFDDIFVELKTEA